MISEIDKKMYELMTEEQNFDFAHYIYNNYDSIVDKLKNEFLIELLNKIHNECKDLNIKKNEEYSYYYEINSRYKKVKYYFQINEEKIEYGIVLTHNGTLKKIREIEELFKLYLEELNYSSIYKKGDCLFWLYQNGDEDFNELSNLKKLLPKNRDLLINKYCQKITKLINEESEEINEFERNS